MADKPEARTPVVVRLDEMPNPAGQPADDKKAPEVSAGRAFLYGVLGAFLGSLPGMAVWIILGKFGIRALILGFFLAAGTVWGYGRMTKKYPLWRGWGILICSVFLISSVYLAQKITWTWGITSAFKDTNDYLKEQIMEVQSGDANVSEESVDKSIESLNRRTFGFSKGTFANCYTHFYSLLDFLGLKKDFISALIQSYISAALGAASLLKNKVRNRVDRDLTAAKKPERSGNKDIKPISNKLQGEKNGN
jgi:hypothetical protein